LVFGFAISGVFEISGAGMHVRQRGRSHCRDTGFVRRVGVETAMGEAPDGRGGFACEARRRIFVGRAGCADNYANLRCKFAVGRSGRFNPAARNENLSTPGFHSTSPLFPGGVVLLPRSVGRAVRAMTLTKDAPVVKRVKGAYIG